MKRIHEEIINSGNHEEMAYQEQKHLYQNAINFVATQNKTIKGTIDD